MSTVVLAKLGYVQCVGVDCGFESMLSSGVLQGRSCRAFRKRPADRSRARMASSGGGGTPVPPNAGPESATRAAHSSVRGERREATQPEDGSPMGLRANVWSPASIVSVLLLLAVIGVSVSAILNSQKGAVACPECNCGSLDGAPHARETVDETALGLGLSVLCITVVACILTSYYLQEKQISAMPDCIAYVLIGVFVGSTIRIAGASNAAGYALPGKEQLFLFILPPIIFEAGYSLNKQDFFSEWVSILAFAVIGTLVSALFYGFGMYLLGTVEVSYPFSLWDALKFGALISAVDPVATIAVFSALRVNKTLHFLVFGESVLNDAVAIVLYQTFSDLGSAGEHTTFYKPILNFFFMFVGSFVVGVVTACVTALLLKYTRLSATPTLELSLYVLMAYLPYFICEGLGMSGIMGILASGVTLAHYAFYNLSRISQISSQQAFRFMSFIAETFLFVYLGIALTSFRHLWDIKTLLFGILLTLVSRAVNIYPLALVLNRYRSQQISAKNQFIMWFSGLRGAIAFALSLNFTSILEETQRVVVATTLGIVLFTVIVLGGGIMPLLRLLRVEGAADSNMYREVSHGPKVLSMDAVKNSPLDSGTNASLAEFAAASPDVDQVDEQADADQMSFFAKLDRLWLAPALTVPYDRGDRTTESFQRLVMQSDYLSVSPHEMGEILSGGTH
ncbi:Sodium/hydrogen exchanger 8 [Porphyridium purpureum]|uniref:Sodium/hydrogen exchanger n=1 Tax=Porphyridium purpureum TaxID=35688 RepID=A0A5J4Z3W0_PORPP|nr:Sodium/hydrogen exchanger 8 [Porphyridium purpureum]|eukprot:POR7733..scf295_1